MTDRNFKITDMLQVQQGESERGPLEVAGHHCGVNRECAVSRPAAAPLQRKRCGHACRGEGGHGGEGLVVGKRKTVQNPRRQRLLCPGAALLED